MGRHFPRKIEVCSFYKLCECFAIGTVKTGRKICEWFCCKFI